VTIWSSVALHNGPVGLLQRDIETGRIAHAYLFGGVAGRLPSDAALAFGASLVCPEGGCGTCEVCVRVMHRAHPDVEIIEPAGTQLLVDQVREVVRSASRRPVAAARRVIIVEGADRMNPNAQNAFLKALEEPPPSTTIVLLAPSPEALLETVRSRCREVTFRSPPPAEVATLLERDGIDGAQAEMLARIGGDLDRATRLASDPEARALRSELVARVVAPLRDPGEALEAAEWLALQTKGLRDRVAEVHKADRETYSQWYQETKRVADDRLRREQRRAEQDAIESSVDDIASVLRDLLVAATDEDAKLLNEDVRSDVVRRSRALGASSAARIVACLSDIERSRRRLRANANVLLTLEDVFLALYRHLA
jgi:DNA polymerase-3 subunit delta'